jgi:PrtD family type I secretion system ABC transporter
MSSSFSASLRAPLATALAFSLAINLALLTPSLFMLQVFDRVLTTRSVETLLMLGVMAALTLGAMGVLEQLRSRTLAAMGIRLEQQHGARLLRQLLAAAAQRGGGAAYLDGMRDLATVRSFLSAAGVVALFDAPWIVVYVVVIGLFHPLLGLLAAAFALLLLGLAWLNERSTRTSLATLQSGARQASRQVDEALRHAEVIGALGMPDAIAQRWQQLTQASHGVQLGVSRAGGTFNAISRVARQMVQVVMLGVGAWLVIQQGATAGVMLAATIILGRALAPVEQLIGGWKALVDARAAYRRLQPLLDAPDEGTVATQLPRPTGRLDVEAVSYVPPGSQRPLLHNVSLSVKPGQAIAVVGASGAGKTTLARLLAGVMPPSAGAIRLDGADLRMWSVQRRGEWIGYLPQNVALLAGSIADNIARLGQPVDSQAVLAAAKLANAHDLILRLPAGYDTDVGADGARLSGGQRQRVALARAVYGKPALVVLDEADASLDADGEQALLETIRALKALGSAVVVISQRRAVLSVADGVVVMRDGRIERVAEREVTAPRNPAMASVHGGPATAPLQREGQVS